MPTNNHTLPAENEARGSWDAHHRVFFHADDIHLEMILAAVGDDRTVIGQVFAEDGRLFPALTVRLIYGEERRTAITNYVGEFIFNQLESSSFVVELEFPDGPVAGRFQVE